MAVIDKNSPPFVRHLDGKTVVVVGGSSGIGFGVAQAALEHGAKVIIASSSQVKVDKAVQRLKAVEGVSSDSVFGSAVDAKDEQALEKFWDGVGKVDHMVWTAGDVARLASGPPTRSAFDLRYWGPVLSAKYLAKHGLISLDGSITFTTGVNSQKPMPGWAWAAGVGGALNAATRGLAVDLAPIRVNCVSPGPIETELFDMLGTPEQRAAALKMYAEHTLVKHVGTPQECAEAYLFCMKCGFYTGQTLHVEGGVLLAPS